VGADKAGASCDEGFQILTLLLALFYSHAGRNRRWQS
jgi:hypothetical protein